MASIVANGLKLEYEEQGSTENPVVMLIRGVSSQLTDWPEDFINGLVDQGFRVIYHDNRDCGLSAKLDELGVPDLATALLKKSRGELVLPPYAIDDMARDVIGLQDALGIGAAHIVGISMGGSISQRLAAKYPDRVLSLVSIMSGSGNPNLPPARPEALAALTGLTDVTKDRENAISFGAETLRIIGSPGYPESEAYRRKVYTARYDRCYHPVGTARQLMAVLAEGSHVDLLKTITVPSLVIHGTDDPLVPVEGGKDTAANIPGAVIELIDGMGHNIPLPLVPKLVDLIAGFIKNNRNY